MNKVASLFAFCAFAFLLVLQVGMSSCTKDNTIYDTVVVKDTVVVNDTVVVKDTAITTALLTANSWKLQEIRGVTDNTILFYQRGGSANTENFDTEYITFNANKTGSYNDGFNNTTPLTWDFLNTENTKLTFTLTPATAPYQTIFYENLRYKNGALWFDQYWTVGGKNHHGQVIRTPK